MTRHSFKRGYAVALKRSFTRAREVKDFATILILGMYCPGNSPYICIQPAITVTATLCNNDKHFLLKIVFDTLHEIDSGRLVDL